jgi:hypothetical protein
MWEMLHLHVRYGFAYGIFSQVLKFISDSEATVTRLMSGKLGVGIQFFAPYVHRQILGKAKHPWRTLKDCASTMMYIMSIA